jgi:hypothetical protein
MVFCKCNNKIQKVNLQTQMGDEQTCFPIPSPSPYGELKGGKRQID